MKMSGKGERKFTLPHRKSKVNENPLSKLKTAKLNWKSRIQPKNLLIFY